MGFHPASYIRHHLPLVILLLAGIIIAASVFVELPFGQNYGVSPDLLGERNLRVAPKGFLPTDLSPHFGAIELTAAKRGPFDAFSVITIVSRSDAGTAPIELAGWTLKSRSASMAIPLAEANYRPDRAADLKPIRLGRNERISVYLENETYRDPLGADLQINICSGYLNDHYAVTPPLPRACPKPPSTLLLQLSPECRAFIGALSMCEEPASLPLNIPDRNKCRFLMDQFVGYTGCVESFKNEPAFPLGEWRIYRPKGKFLGAPHDRVLLFDGAGLLAAVYSY